MPAPDLPQLTEHGLLPEGVHRMTLEQVEMLFGRFQRSDRRCRLFAKLKELVEECTLTGWVAALIIDGSFVMGSVDEPEDIDLILLLPSDWDFSAELRPFEYNLVAKSRTKRNYGLDVFAVRETSTQEHNFVELFSGVNPKWQVPPLSLPPGLRKGLLRIDL